MGLKMPLKWKVLGVRNFIKIDKGKCQNLSGFGHFLINNLCFE
jgi:hypothetical protein